MKISIETYKGQEIYYDDDYDKFLCDISVEDKFKSSKRASLKDLRKEIDKFIKDNQNFKPFKVITSNYGGVSVNEVRNIRTDGLLMVYSANDSYGLVDPNNLKAYEKFYNFNQNIIDSITDLKSKRDAFNKKIDSEINQIKSELIPFDFSKF